MLRKHSCLELGDHTWCLKSNLSQLHARQVPFQQLLLLVLFHWTTQRRKILEVSPKKEGIDGWESLPQNLSCPHLAGPSVVQPCSREGCEHPEPNWAPEILELGGWSVCICVCLCSRVCPCVYALRHVCEHALLLALTGPRFLAAVVSLHCWACNHGKLPAKS